MRMRKPGKESERREEGVRGSEEDKCMRMRKPGKESERRDEGVRELEED